MIACRYRAWLEDGDSTALEPELAGIMPSLGRRAQYLLGNASDADDAVQDALLVLLRERVRLPADLPLHVIMLRLVREQALMLARSRSRRWRRNALMEVVDRHAVSEPTTELPSDLERRFARLPARSRAVLEGLARGEEATTLAQRLGLSRAQVHMVIHRARREVRPAHASAKRKTGAGTTFTSVPVACQSDKLAKQDSISPGMSQPR